MSALRTWMSALCIVLGALLIATWAASWAALNSIENGTVIEDATARAIVTESAQTALVENATEQVLIALDAAGIDSTTPGIEGITQALIAAIVSSEGFVDLVHAQTKSIREQVVASLNGDETGSITIELDLSPQVNDKLAQIPVIGDSLPEIAVPSIPVQVMDDATADRARTAWDALHFAKAWFLWIGLAFVALGILVSHRKRWYFAKLFLAIGVIAGVLWLLLTAFEPQTIAERIAGGGVVDAVIVEIVSHAQGTVVTTMGWVAVGAMMVSLVMFGLASRGTKGVRS